MSWVINIIMRIHEFSNPLKTYLATVRVVLRGTSSTVRTTITADSASDAMKLLAAIVGMNNVLNVSHIVSEAPQTDQIQREQAIRPQAVCRQVQPRNVAQIQPLQVQQQKRNRKRTVTARPIASPIKHELVQQHLYKHMLHQANIVKPTSDDIRIAKSRAETALKKANLDYEKQVAGQLRKQERENRNKRKLEYPNTRGKKI
jgi:hypothetical protein